MRILAGGSYLNAIMLLKIGRSTMYDDFNETLFVIRDVSKVPGIPLNDELELNKLTQRFYFQKLNQRLFLDASERLMGLL